MEAELATDLALALDLADHADGLTSAAFRRGDLVVETKPDLTPVTEADRGTEEALRRLLAAQRPDDAVVGEEQGETGRGRRRWIIDPIDGTKNFVRGMPVWATLIALEIDGDVAVGVASAPALGRRWWAARGLGAFAGDCGVALHEGELARPAHRGLRIRVSKVAELADAQLSSGGTDGWGAHGGPGRLLGLAERCRRHRGFGDFWSHVLVAEGSVDVAAEPEVSVWDVAAVQVIV
ncbi:MAG: inositol monophosphatase family protein, partial [Acidimicrobiales bacterium]